MPGPTAPEEPEWLDADEMAAWLPLIRLVYRLPQALDRHLRDEMGISHLWYTMLAHLSAAPDRTLSMGELARLAVSSPSRLSNAVSSMEKQGWVERRRCTTDARIQFATLTDAGFAKLERVAPSHVAEVRRLVFDHLDGDQVAQLREMGETLVAALDDRESGSPE
jgi:DNA-binding MarR family transcriptional regulator